MHPDLKKKKKKGTAKKPLYYFPAAKHLSRLLCTCSYDTKLLGAGSVSCSLCIASAALESSSVTKHLQFLTNSSLKQHSNKHQIKPSPFQTELIASFTYLGRPLIQAARSFVMKPDSMVSIHTSSRAAAKVLRLVLLSSLAL